MDDKGKDPAISSSNEEFEMLKLQYASSINGIYTFFGQMVTVLTIVFIAFVTLLGLAINNKNAGVIFLGALFPIFIYLYVRWNRDQQLSMIYTATIIEDKINPNGFDGFMRIFLVLAIIRNLLMRF